MTDVMGDAMARARFLTTLLAAFAGLALLLAAVGTYGVMSYAVTQRDRELGIRMAMGARAGDILRQFLAEALMLAVVGGLIGFLIGHLTGFVAATFGTRVIFTAQAAATALLCSVVTGLVFGFMPARRAARLDPVVALARE